MTVQARIAVLPAGQRELVIHDVDIDAVGPHEVVVEQRSFGVCQSQLARINRTDRTEPMVLGHESIGRVVLVGDEVTYVRPGDTVFVSWIPRSPLGGRAAAPTQVHLPTGEVARTHNTFTWGTHAVVDEQYLVRAPAESNPDLGPIIGCALMTGAGAVINTADVGTGESVAVWGTGGVGLCSVAGASIRGAGVVIAVDIDDAKLELAREFGATHVVNARVSDPVTAIRELTPHEDGTAGVDHSIDCTGLGDNVSLSLQAVRPGVRGTGERGGVAVMVGVPRAPFPMNSMDLLDGEKSLLGCIGGSAHPERDFAIYAEWAADGRFDPSALVTNRYSLDDLNRAVEDLQQGRVLGRAVIDL